MSFELALKAGIPLISVTTNDTVNLMEVLEELCPKKVLPYVNAKKVLPDQIYWYTGKEITSVDAVYTEFAAQQSSLIIVNPDAPHRTYYNAGVLPTPQSLVYEFLSSSCSMSEKQAKTLIPALGGLSLKEITDVLMLTQARTGGTVNSDIIQTRQMYLNRAQGLEIVHTDLKGYVPHPDVQHVAQDEKQFFLGDYDPRLRPRGIMAFGLSGTGKSLGARYLAQQWGVPLFRLEAGIQSKWVGESEANLTAALKQVESLQPAIILIDESEKLFSTGSDGGVTSKLLGSLLWWMQEHQAKVLTYMTCNDLSKLPVELYRQGRIDHRIEFFGLNVDDGLKFAEQVATSYTEPYERLDDLKSRIISLYDHATSEHLSHADIHACVQKIIKRNIRGKKKLTP